MGNRRTAGWSSPDNRFPSRLTHLLPATRWPALDDRLAPNPVAGIGGVAYLAEVSRERAPSTCECAIDRSDALAAHHLGRRVRGLSLLNSGLIPQVPFPQFLFTFLGIVLLWVWKLRNDSEDRFAARFVNVLGVYFSLFVLIYGAHRLVPHASGLGNLYPMLDAWLPLGCGFALVSHQ